MWRRPSRYRSKATTWWWTSRFVIPGRERTRNLEIPPTCNCTSEVRSFGPSRNDSKFSCFRHCEKRQGRSNPCFASSPRDGFTCARNDDLNDVSHPLPFPRIAHQRDKAIDAVHEFAVGHGDEQRKHHAEMQRQWRSHRGGVATHEPREAGEA